MEGFNSNFVRGSSKVKPMSAEKANMFRTQMSTKIQKKLPSVKKSEIRYPPKIDIMAEARTLEEERAATAPAWQTKTPAKEVVINKQAIHFGVPAQVGLPTKSALELAKERKRKKKEDEESARKAAELAEKTKFDHMPEWKKAMFVKKEQQQKEAAKPEEALFLRAKQVEEMFADMPGWQAERAIKKEKRRILLEEGLIIP